MTKIKDPNSIIEIFRNQPGFCALSDEQFGKIAQHMHIKEYNKGQIVAEQGDPRSKFFFLIAGVMRTERYDIDGENNYYEYINTNTGLPYAGLFSLEEYPYSIVCLTPVTVIVMAMKDFECSVCQNAYAMMTIVKRMSELINYNQSILQIMVTSSAVDRVQHALEVFRQVLGSKNKNGSTYVSYPISLTELAEVSATSRETATTVVNNLVLDHSLTYQNKHFNFLHEFHFTLPCCERLAG